MTTQHSTGHIVVILSSLPSSISEAWLVVSFVLISIFWLLTLLTSVIVTSSDGELGDENECRDDDGLSMVSFFVDSSFSDSSLGYSKKILFCRL